MWGWVGTSGFSTRVPSSGRLEGLPTGTHGFREKLIWRVPGLDWQRGASPHFVIQGVNLSAPGAPMWTSEPTQAFAEDLGSVVVVMVEFPVRGCWEVKAQLGSEAISYVIEVVG